MAEGTLLTSKTVLLLKSSKLIYHAVMFALFVSSWINKIQAFATVTNFCKDCFKCIAKAQLTQGKFPYFHPNIDYNFNKSVNEINSNSEN